MSYLDCSKAEIIASEVWSSKNRKNRFFRLYTWLGRTHPQNSFCYRGCGIGQVFAKQIQEPWNADVVEISVENELVMEEVIILLFYSVFVLRQWLNEKSHRGRVILQKNRLLWPLFTKDANVISMGKKYFSHEKSCVFTVQKCFGVKILACQNFGKKEYVMSVGRLQASTYCARSQPTFFKISCSCQP